VAAAPLAAPQAPSGPLSANNLRELELAQRRAKRIRRAIGVARFNGWTIGSFAGLSLLLGIFSLTSLLVGLALAVVSYNEFSGAKALQRFDSAAPRRLGLNQIGLCCVVILYSLWSIYSTLTGPNPYEAAMAAGGQAVEILGSIEQLQNTLTFGVYGAVIVLSIIFQGGMAWYYFTRKRLVRGYVSETPGWIIDLQRATSPL
jgi:hypothetical protein